MVQFNFAEKTIKAKVVYYGPAKSGKTTNLEQIHRLTDPSGTNSLVSLNTAQDRTLFFDLLPISLGQVSGYEFKIQVYTVPGQVQYNATRRVVLAGADAVVFVADSRKSMAKENVAAFENMKVNLLANRLVPEKVPLVLQYNKRDMPEIETEAELNKQMNAWGRKAFPGVAATGDGVIETFSAVAQEMLQSIAIKYNLKDKGLDPNAVPTLVETALRNLTGKASAAAAAAPKPAGPGGKAPISPSKITVTQGQTADQSSTAGGEGGLVVEELLQKAIKSNVDMAEVMTNIMQAVTSGLGAILSQADLALAHKEEIKRNASIAAIKREADLMQRKVQALASGQPVPTGAPGPAARIAQQLGAAARPAPAPPKPGGPLPPPPVASAAPAAPPKPAAPAVAVSPNVDAAVREGVRQAQPALAAMSAPVEIFATGDMPRCSAADLTRLVKSGLEGFAALSPSGRLHVRTERKPVLLKSRDGSENRREFLMVSVVGGVPVPADEQQKIPQGSGTGALGDAGRLVRELGGFTRFAPTPTGGSEVRFFVPI